MTSESGGRSKTRLDLALVARGLAESRAKAQAMILAGEVYSGETRLDKAGLEIAPDRPLDLRRRTGSWVSRGAFKLLRGLGAFAIDPKGAVCLDVGASTGGFTEVLLARGAAKVYAVDVGHGQLHYRLRDDPRVVVLERTNARALDATAIGDPIDLVTCDVSFISLTKALPAALALTRDDARLVALIKPQFEAERNEIGKGGVVRDPAIRARICETIGAWLERDAAWRVLGVVESPITGPKGNVEFLIGGAAAGREAQQRDEL